MNKIHSLIALVIYVIAAIYTTGYYHPDEHYQIVEFAELKTGKNKPNDLAWEYKEGIRPTIQPSIFYLFLTAIRETGINDPYYILTIIRVITAFIAVFVIGKFTQATIESVPKYLKTSYQLLAYFLWFLPFINVRYSSETYSGLAFMASIIVFHNSSNNRFFMIGTLLGLSFIFRFQTAFLSLGFILWLLLIYKIRFQDLFLLITGCLTIFYLGIVIDLWFYGTFIIAPVNYFYANIVEDVASSFGISPWYFYFTSLLKPGTFLIGVLILASFLCQLIFRNKELLVWIIVPFLLIHIITPHKEIRFLFPIANFLPLLIIQFIHQINQIPKGKFCSFLQLPIITCLLATNGLALTLVIFAPADEGGEGKMNITQYIHNNFSDRKVNLWCMGRINPYKPIPVKQGFYLDKNVTQIALDTTVGSDLFNTKELNLIVIQNRDFEKNKNFLNQFEIDKLTDGVPSWITRIKDYAGYEASPYSLSLYRINKILF